nr:gonadal somatic cell derived factor [Nothobranchius furzeri]
MSLTFVMMLMLLGSAVVNAFVLHPSKEEPAANSAFPRQRCPDESLRAIRKSLLGELNLQSEPQLPAGVVDSIRKQWQRTFSTVSLSAKDTAGASDVSESHDGGNSTGLQCCSMASEIFMKDLGWDTWMIHPVSLTIVQCAACNPVDNSVQCPSSSSSSIQADLPCCQPASQKMVSIAYMDETGAINLSSVQLTRSCGCEPGNAQQQSRK